MSVFSKVLNKYLSISIYSPRKGQFAILASDVTDEIMHAQTVERLAYYDRLTGLPNRIKLTEVLSRAFDSGTGVSPYGTLLYIDMDDLKLVNDSYGHSYGDAMIIIAAMYLVSMAVPDSIVARVGGDEFIVLIPGMTDSEKVEQIASEFVETLSRDYEVRDLRFHASASIGIVMYPRDGESAEEILRNADTALYEAKRSGKRCWRFFRQSMQETAYGNMQLINGLQNALINQELEVYFQPQMSLKSGKLTGFEALLRWNSPNHGDISPALFIPLIEKSLLIETIGAWTMKEACKFARALADNGYPEIRVAVNVSPRQLKAADFISIVRDSCKESDLMPANLEIEITENTFIESMEECVHKLDELRAMGVHLSLDDFGTGYSSLTYLRSLPVQTLKIDKSFIDLLSKDKAVSELIASIIDMAHVLGLVVVAEGVETQEQMQRLIQCGCDTIQGYIVSRAVPAAAALKYLRTGNGSVRLNLLDASVI
jgi:diguanylate cyclase (GGDEF)-like protein